MPGYLVWAYKENVLSSKLVPGKDGSTKTAPAGAKAGRLTVVAPAVTVTTLANVVSLARRMASHC